VKFTFSFFILLVTFVFVQLTRIPERLAQQPECGVKAIISELQFETLDKTTTKMVEGLLQEKDVFATIASTNHKWCGKWNGYDSVAISVYTSILLTIYSRLFKCEYSGFHLHIYYRMLVSLSVPANEEDLIGHSIGGLLEA
jgi:hypothetical protein